MKGKLFLIKEIEYTNSFCSGKKKCPWLYRKRYCKLFGKLDVVKTKPRRCDECINNAFAEEIPNVKEEEEQQEQEAEYHLGT